MTRSRIAAISVCFAILAGEGAAQSVCLPAPRLLTTTPMGAQAGQTIDVVVSGDNLDGATALTFSHPGITAAVKLDEDGNPVANTWVVSVRKDVQPGVHDAHVMTRLGMSSARAFTVGRLPEVTRTTTNTSLQTALPLALNSICNAYVTSRQVDFYTIEAREGQRLIVDCAARGIDSRLKPVLVVADESGADLQVERRGGVVDFRVPKTGLYVIKVNDLTYNGGETYFYRLAVQEAADDAIVSRLPGTSPVHRASWPLVDLPTHAATAEVEPNHGGKVQAISLPCDISGRFFPAADVDTFEFTAKKGEVWWVEVASERLGCPTDPAVVIQHVTRDGESEKLIDVVELNDIPSPVKTSSNGYSYDGPPYNVGSSDVLGRLEIKADGIHRLHVRDLFGGTRTDPQNVYRLLVRKARPDFALAGWALHMGLRNGDRNALSKPIALRGGATMPLEIVVVRRDGFSGEINLTMENLPDGVSATGLKIPTGESVGTMLITADQNAPRGVTSARLFGTAVIDGEEIIRECRLASMAWPVPNAKSEIPAPRLMADIPVSVGGSEFAPLSIAGASDGPFEVTEGETLTIPLINVRRCEFQGASMSLATFGHGFNRNAAFDLSLESETNEAVLNLATLKIKPGEYTIAFYGGGVAKYQHRRHEVAPAESRLAEAKAKADAASVELEQARKIAAAATEDGKSELQEVAKQAELQKQTADAKVKEADEQFRAAQRTAAAKDIVDIIVTSPIRIRVNPGAP